MHAPDVFFKALWYRAASSTATTERSCLRLKRTRAAQRRKDRNSSPLIDVNDKLAVRLPIFNQIVGDVGICECEAAPIQFRGHLSCLDQSGSFPHDIAMMCAAFACQKWIQRKDAGIRRLLERKRRQCMRSPAETADHVPEAVDRQKGCVETAAADGVINEIEALATRVGLDIALDGLARAVDRRRTEAPEVVGLRGAVDSIDM
jgi:hypothetical protein